MAGTCFPQNHSELLHAFPLFIYFNANYLIPLFVSTTLLEPIPALIINHNFVSPTMPRKKAPVAASPAPAMQESPSQPRGAKQSKVRAPAQRSARKSKTASSTARTLDTPPRPDNVSTKSPPSTMASTKRGTKRSGTDVIPIPTPAGHDRRTRNRDYSETPPSLSLKTIHEDRGDDVIPSPTTNEYFASDDGNVLPPPPALPTINEESCRDIGSTLLAMNEESDDEDDHVIVVSVARANDDNYDEHDSNTDDRKLPAKNISDKNFRPREAKQGVVYGSDSDTADVDDAKDPTYSCHRGDDDEFANMSDLDLSDDDVYEKKTAGRKRNKGGPAVPAKGSVSDEAYVEAVKMRKRYNDAERYKRAKASGSTVAEAGSTFTGVCDDQLRTMARVKEYRLQEGHTFPNKDILWIRIVEEAVLRGKYLTTYRSDAFNLIVYSDRFFVGASFIGGIGWKVNIAAVREGDAGLNKKLDDMLLKMNITVQQRREKQRSKQGVKSTKERNPPTPLDMQWVANIIKPMLADDPSLSYSDIRTKMKDYANDYAVTDALIQDAKELAREELFGSPEQNVKYASGVASELVAMGHHVELKFGSRKDVDLRIGKVVLMEEGYRRKDAGEDKLRPQERKPFVDAWREKHAIELDSSLGLEDGPSHCFLLGICFATSASVSTVPLLEKVVQADAAHMNIGKYTLFSAYSASANGNMSPIAFAILFGNEDTSNWTIFWEFVKKVRVP